MWAGPNNFFSRVGGHDPPANILWRRPCPSLRRRGPKSQNICIGADVNTQISTFLLTFCEGVTDNILFLNSP